MDETSEKPSKQPYHPPKLEVHGTMQELTATGGEGGLDGPGPSYAAIIS